MAVNETMQPKKFAEAIIAIAKISNPRFKDLEQNEKESMKAYWEEVGKAIKDYVSSAKITATYENKPVIIENIE